jgi:NADPH2:quinone reductase
MRGVRLTEPTPALDVNVGELEMPTAGRGEVVVAVRAAGVNRSDVLNVKGVLPIVNWPRTPGRDYAGEVVDGPSEHVGRRVWGTGGHDLGFTRDGSHAECLTLPADALVDIPPELSFEDAAACGLPLFTAGLALLRLAPVRAGGVVLVIGAAGGVGSAAVELARWRGATVMAAVKDAVEAAAVRERGIESVVDTSAVDLGEAVMDATAGAGVDVVVDTVGPPVYPAAAAVLGLDGRLVAITAPPVAPVEIDLGRVYRMRHQIIGLSTVAYDVGDIARLLRELAEPLACGEVAPPPVGARFALDQVAAAYAAVDAGSVRGRTLLVARQQ